MKTKTGLKSIILFTDFYKPDNKYIYVTEPWDIYNLAQKTGVPVYPVDSRGVVAVIPGGEASTSDGSAAAVNSNLLSRLANLGADQNTLAYIAFETGGKYVGGNDLSSTFDEMNRDAAASYELAYYKRALKHDGKFHQVKVRVKRPGLHVRAAGGYFAETGDLRTLVSDHHLRFALNSERPFDGILVSLHPLFFPVTTSDASSVVAIMGIGLDWGSSDGSPVPGPTTVLGVVRGPDNRVE